MEIKQTNTNPILHQGLWDLYFWLINRRQQRRMRRAIRKANKMWLLSGVKFFCLWYKGKPLVKSKQNLKELIKQGAFKKGLTIHDIEKMAFYVTL